MAKDHGRSIKDDEKYEALREEGYSKERAAKISNAGDEASRKGGRKAAKKRKAGKKKTARKKSSRKKSSGRTKGSSARKSSTRKRASGRKKKAR